MERRCWSDGRRSTSSFAGMAVRGWFRRQVFPFNPVVGCFESKCGVVACVARFYLRLSRPHKLFLVRAGGFLKS